MLEDLPLRKGDPPFSAWDLWENAEVDGLNYLSDKVVLAAAKESIQTGTRVVNYIQHAVQLAVGWLWKSQFAAVAADSYAFECSRNSLLHVNI